MHLLMNQKKKADLIFSSKIIIPIIIVICLFQAGISIGVITFQAPKIEKFGEVKAIIEIDFGDGIKYSKDLSLVNATVLDFLLNLEVIGDIIIEKTYWEQFESYVIDSISYQGTRYVADTNHYWGYYLNDEIGLVGADQQIVNKNDIITWKFESF